jgi:hypothetical protein
MEKIISEKFGCRIVKRNEKYFIQYDNGQSASWMVENEITKDEAEKAILSEEFAYEVILAAQKRSKPNRLM